MSTSGDTNTCWAESATGAARQPLGLEAAARDLRAATLQRMIRSLPALASALHRTARKRLVARLPGRLRMAPARRARGAGAPAIASVQMPLRRRRLRPLALALQGGGAHGAYTWGVLDRLLEVPGFVPDAISGTSAGAMNAVALAAGWAEDGAPGARAKLHRLWHGVVETARLAPGRHGPLPRIALDVAAHLLSPYQLNPLGLNPLADLLGQLVDFERLRDPKAPRLLLAATDVATGGLRLFENHEIDTRAVLASACLPQLFHAVEIDGRAYWDGGYVSNPPILALVERARVRDVLLVQINPLESRGLPTDAGSIRSRAGEITFGRPLADELERLRVLRSVPLAWLDPARRRLTRCRLETIDGSGDLDGLPAATRLMPDAETVLHLQQLGRAAADAWLDRRGRGTPVVAGGAAGRSTRPAA